MRVRNKEQTRARLLDAGWAVSAESGLADMSVARVVEHAGSSKGAFFHHFPDRDSFVVALHDDFHERMAEAIAQAAGEQEPGADRMRLAARAYWAFCLRERGVRAMLLDARGHGPIAAASRRRSAEAAASYAADLRLMGVRDAAVSARLVVAAATEVGLLEMEVGKRQPAARRAFERIVAGLPA